MIVSRLIGGLGNQMFQYAAGRALSLRLGVPFFIDIRAFSEYKTHAFGMSCFQAELTVAPAKFLPNPASEGRIQGLLRKFMASPLKVFSERSYTFDSEVLMMPDNIYLDGYWQTEKYFSDFADAIRSDFTVRHAPSDANQCWLTLASESQSVSLHIRRGDYVTNATAAAMHGVCDLAYYERAVEYLREVTGINPVLFVFSDDLDWVAANLKLPFEMHLIRDNNAKTNYEDLRLMSACKHNIIANSSFSWWGAWLNPNPNKVVVAPINWFKSGHSTTQDLIPESWHRL